MGTNHELPPILVVDDERDFLTLTKTLLQRNGYQVQTRTRAPNWVDLAQIDPALILMDVQLEGENGSEVCKAIKVHKRLGRLPVILISGQTEDRLKKEVDRCEADGYLTKPISKALLLQLAEHYVKRHLREGGLHRRQQPIVHKPTLNSLPEGADPTERTRPQPLEREPGVHASNGDQPAE